MAKIINGLSDIADRDDYFILDLFGVIHNGVELFPGTRNCLEQLNAAGKQICLLSNTPRRAPGTIAQTEALGLPGSLFHHVVTSGEMTYNHLAQMEPGVKCWFIGTDIMAEVLEGHDLVVLDGPEGADFVLNSVPGIHKMGDAVFIESLKIAAAAGLPMICANPDLVVNIGDQQYQCAGTFAKMYEEMGGEVTYHGKPHAPVYEQCYAFFGQPDKSRICAVGDSFHTDVTGANGFGVDVIWNIEGVHEEEVICDLSGGISDDLIENVIEFQSTTPNYVMKDFQW